MSEPEPGDAAPELRADTTILRIQDPDTGETVVLVLRISGGTIEAIAVEE